MKSARQLSLGNEKSSPCDTTPCICNIATENLAGGCRILLNKKLRSKERPKHRFVYFSLIGKIISVLIVFASQILGRDIFVPM